MGRLNFRLIIAAVTGAVCVIVVGHVPLNKTATPLMLLVQNPVVAFSAHIFAYGLITIFLLGAVPPPRGARVHIIVFFIAAAIAMIDECTHLWAGGQVELLNIGAYLVGTIAVLSISFSRQPTSTRTEP